MTLEGRSKDKLSRTLAFASIPQALRDTAQWVAWGKTPPPKPGAKFGKLPINSATGGNASSTDPASWGTFDAAVDRAIADELAGVGFVFTEASRYVGIDLDGCIDPSTGEIAAWALEIVRACPGYTERSPSGTGLHVIVLGVLPHGGRKKDKIEMYSTGRFFTMTGDIIAEFSQPIVDRTPELAALHARVFGPKRVTNATPTPTPAPDTTDDALIARAIAAANGAKFEALFAGDLSSYGSHSEADLALCDMIAFWTGPDAARIDAVFRRSGLIREKWDERHGEQTYGQRTIEKALAGRTEFHKGGARAAASTAASKPAPGLKAYRPFPVDLLPEPLSSFVHNAGMAVGCDAAFVALPLLASLGSAIGNTARVELRGGWREPPVLWAVPIGESGSVKSPGFDVAVGPLRKLQNKAMADHRRQMKEYDRARKQYEKDFSKWKRGGKGDLPPEEPTEPLCRRYVASDVTVEALAVRLNETPRGLLLASEELAAWANSFNQYKGGRGGDAAHWLEMHGARPMTVDRKTGFPKTINVPMAAVCVTGTIQPGTLRRALAPEHFESGLAARLLFAQPPRRARKWTDVELDPALQERVEMLFDALVGVDLGLDEYGVPIPAVYRLDAKARELFVTFVNEHGQEQLELESNESAAWSKLEGYAARIALIIHCARRGSSDPGVGLEIDATSMSAGIALARWFGYEAKRAYAMCAETPEAEAARRAIERIQRNGGAVTIREWQRMRSAPTAEVAERELQQLVQSGVGTWEQIPPTAQGGRPSKRFKLTIATDETPLGEPSREVVSLSVVSEQAPSISTTAPTPGVSPTSDVVFNQTSADTTDTDRTPVPVPPDAVLSVDPGEEWGSV